MQGWSPCPDSLPFGTSTTAGSGSHQSPFPQTWCCQSPLLIARTFKVCKDNCKIEACAFSSGFWVYFFYQTSSILSRLHPSKCRPAARRRHISAGELIRVVVAAIGGGEAAQEQWAGLLWIDGFSGSFLIPSWVTHDSAAIFLLRPRDTPSGLPPRKQAPEPHRLYFCYWEFVLSFS